MRRRILVAPLLLSAVLASCEKPAEMEPWTPQRPTKDYNRPLPPGQLALRKIPPERYPDFGAGFYNKRGLADAVRRSLNYLRKASSRRFFPYGDVTHERAVASLHAFLEVLERADSPQALDGAIRDGFDVYQSVGCDDAGTVLFTGYYCPIFEGRRQREGPFRYPLYGAPPDLMKDADGNILGRRTPEGGVAPYHTRAEIEEQRLLQGLEVAWLKDPFEAYVVSVQGSGKLRQADGSIYEVGYAGNNGHTYEPVADAMIADGVIRREELSLQTLLHYFAAHPQDVAKYTRKNPRFVFFKESPGGPYGSINERVTPYRTIATDKEIYPRACLAYVTTRMPAVQGDQVVQKSFSSFVLDQDTGGAIRAAGRCDVFIGTGPAAERVAGRVYSEGAVYYVFLKELAQ